MSITAQKSKITIITILFLIIYALIVGWAVYKYIILPSGLFAWDQAAHAVIGSLIAQDIGDGNWLAFFYDLYRQVYWPPVHPLLLGTTFAVTESTPLVARSLSLFLFLGSVLLIYLAGISVGAERGFRVASITAVLFLTSPGLLPFAGQVMLEMTAVFFFILSLLLFFKVDDDNPAWLRVALGLSLVATYLAKSNYGILLFITLAIELLIEARFHLKKFFSRANIMIALPVIITLAIWFAYPPKIQKTWAAMVNIPFGIDDPYSIAGLLFYPKALLHSSGSTAFLILFIISLILVLIKYRSRNLRFLALLIIIQLLIGELHQTKVARHILPVLPALYLCTGYVLAYEAFDFKFHGERIKLSLLITIAALLYAQVLLVGALKPVSTKSDETILTYIADSVSDSQSSLVISTINLNNPTPPLLDWSLITDGSLLQPVHSDVAMNFDQDNTIASYAEKEFIPPALSAMLNSVVKRSEQPGSVRTLFLDNSGSSYSQNPKRFSQYLQNLDQGDELKRVVIVIPDNIEKSMTLAGNVPFTRDYLMLGLNDLGLKQVSTQVFDQVNTRVEIYEK